MPQGYLGRRRCGSLYRPCVDVADLLTVDQAIELWAVVPHWNVRLHGPLVDRHTVTERVVVELRYLTCATMLEATALALEQAALLCDAAGIDYDIQQWSLERLERVNFN